MPLTCHQKVDIHLTPSLPTFHILLFCWLKAMQYSFKDVLKHIVIITDNPDKCAFKPALQLRNCAGLPYNDSAWRVKAAEMAKARLPLDVAYFA